MSAVEVTKFLADEGTLVLFEGVTKASAVVTFAADHRAASAILGGLLADDGPVVAEVPAWTVIGGTI